MSNSQLGFGIAKENYKILLAGIGLIALGYILMIGGGSDSPAVFNPDFQYTTYCCSTGYLFDRFCCCYCSYNAQT